MLETHELKRMPESMHLMSIAVGIRRPVAGRGEAVLSGAQPGATERMPRKMNLLAIWSESPGGPIQLKGADKQSAWASRLDTNRNEHVGTQPL